MRRGSGGRRGADVSRGGPPTGTTPRQAAAVATAAAALQQCAPATGGRPPPRGGAASGGRTKQPPPACPPIPPSPPPGAPHVTPQPASAVGVAAAKAGGWCRKRWKMPRRARPDAARSSDRIQRKWKARAQARTAIQIGHLAAGAVEWGGSYFTVRPVHYTPIYSTCTVSGRGTGHIPNNGLCVGMSRVGSSCFSLTGVYSIQLCPH